MNYRNVIDANGDHRIAAIENDKWITISAGSARLEGREHSEAPYGTQCSGRWLRGTTLTDAETGVLYPDGNG